MLAKAPIPNPIERKKTETFIELSDQDAFTAAQRIVRDAAIPQDHLIEKQDSKARFLSAEDRRVAEETRARASGMTENRATKNLRLKPQIAPRPGQARTLANNPAPNEPSSRAPTSPGANQPQAPGDIAVGGLNRPQNRPTNPDGSRPLNLPPPVAGLRPGQSTTGENLPDDVKFGEMTSLNTDRYVYYSFYARIEEQIRHRWEDHVRDALMTYGRGLKATTYVTQIEVLLDRDGNFVRAIFHRTSGVGPVDKAPAQAFQEAQQIPNPPAEMVKDDGLIHLYYQFNVIFDPRYLASP